MLEGGGADALTADVGGPSTALAAAAAVAAATSVASVASTAAAGARLVAAAAAAASSASGGMRAPAVSPPPAEGGVASAAVGASGAGDGGNGGGGGSDGGAASAATGVAAAAVTVAVGGGDDRPCGYCGRDLTTAAARIRCEACVAPPVELCVDCFSVGAALKPHVATHPYRVVAATVPPAYAADWGADEEARLLDGLLTYGPHHWAAVADVVGTKPARNPSPAGPAVARAGGGGGGSGRGGAHRKGVGKRGRRRGADAASAAATTAVASIAAVSPVADSPAAGAGGSSAQGGTSGSVLGTGLRKGRGGPGATPASPADEAPCNAASDGAGVERDADGSGDGTDAAAPDFARGSRGVIGEDPTALPGGRRLDGYMPARGDFDVEFDDGAEDLVADLVMEADDTPEEVDIKVRLLEIYNARVALRSQRKAFVLERKLLDFEAIRSAEAALPKAERDVVSRLKVFARLHSPEVQAELEAALLEEHRLAARIAQLTAYRAAGVTSLADAAAFDAAVVQRRARGVGGVGRAPGSGGTVAAWTAAAAAASTPAMAAAATGSVVSHGSPSGDEGRAGAAAARSISGRRDGRPRRGAHRAPPSADVADAASIGGGAGTPEAESKAVVVAGTDCGGLRTGARQDAAATGWVPLPIQCFPNAASMSLRERTLCAALWMTPALWTALQSRIVDAIYQLPWPEQFKSVVALVRASAVETEPWPVDQKENTGVACEAAAAAVAMAEVTPRAAAVAAAPPVGNAANLSGVTVSAQLVAADSPVVRTFLTPRPLRRRSGRGRAGCDALASASRHSDGDHPRAPPHSPGSAGAGLPPSPKAVDTPTVAPTPARRGRPPGSRRGGRPEATPRPTGDAPSAKGLARPASATGSANRPHKREVDAGSLPPPLSAPVSKRPRRGQRHAALATTIADGGAFGGVPAPHHPTPPSVASAALAMPAAVTHKSTKSITRRKPAPAPAAPAAQSQPLGHALRPTRKRRRLKVDSDADGESDAEGAALWSTAAAALAASTLTPRSSRKPQQADSDSDVFNNDDDGDGDGESDGDGGVDTDGGAASRTRAKRGRRSTAAPTSPSEQASPLSRAAAGGAPTRRGRRGVAVSDTPPGVPVPSAGMPVGASATGVARGPAFPPSDAATVDGWITPAQLVAAAAAAAAAADAGRPPPDGSAAPSSAPIVVVSPSVPAVHLRRLRKRTRDDVTPDDSEASSAASSSPAEPSPSSSSVRSPAGGIWGTSSTSGGVGVVGVAAAAVGVGVAEEGVGGGGGGTGRGRGRGRGLTRSRGGSGGESVGDLGGPAAAGHPSRGRGARGGEGEKVARTTRRTAAAARAAAGE
ncbi:hypothetical protein MMPV_003849 [Pyropia vietnamensis]